MAKKNKAKKPAARAKSGPALRGGQRGGKTDVTFRGASARAAKRPKKPIKKQPRQPALIRNVRIKALDDVAASIADCRQQRNDADAEELGLKQTALRLMRQHLKTVWKHAGVELIRVPGEERLSVRLSRGEGDAEGETGTERQGNEEVEPESEEPGATEDVDGDLGGDDQGSEERTD